MALSWATLSACTRSPPSRRRGADGPYDLIVIRAVLPDRSRRLPRPHSPAVFSVGYQILGRVALDEA
jgi:hypothetical protein